MKIIKLTTIFDLNMLFLKLSRVMKEKYYILIAVQPLFLIKKNNSASI